MSSLEIKKTDAILLDVFLTPLRECKKYQPAFGSGRKETKSSFEAFEDLYSSDPFYYWLGLASEEVYAAHKAAGGLTSVYRQIGTGSERLFRAILAQQLSLSEQQLNWSYEYQMQGTKNKVHTLDARISCADLGKSKRTRVNAWLAQSLKCISNGRNANTQVGGVAFEVRQGYKSADSKRQNADLRFGINAYQSSLLPAFAVFSNQVSKPVLTRYRADGMLVLTGVMSNDPTISTFAFFNEVIGFDLAAFFERNQNAMTQEVRSIVGFLLKK